MVELQGADVHHVLSPHVAFLPTILGATYPNVPMSRGVAAAVTGFVVVDSVITGALLLGMNVLRVWLASPGWKVSVKRAVLVLGRVALAGQERLRVVSADCALLVMVVQDNTFTHPVFHLRSCRLVARV